MQERKKTHNWLDLAIQLYEEEAKDFASQEMFSNMIARKGTSLWNILDRAI